MDVRYQTFLKRITSRIDSKRVYIDEFHRLAWGADAGFYRLIPKIVILVSNEKEVIHILSEAVRQQIPVTFRAAGTSLSGQSITDSVLVVAGKDWEDYQISPDAEQITLQPGLTGERVNRLLKPYGKKFSPDPASVKSAMIGGIVMNNASGMSCGTHANSDKVIVSARIVFADGMVLDTGNMQSRSEFQRRKPGFISIIESLREQIVADKELTERIRRKYSIKNVMGLNLLPFIEWHDPFDIITHLMVGSEGTLAFLSQVTMRTQSERSCKASTMVYFQDIQSACRAVIALKKLIDPAGRTLVNSAELLDEKALSSVGEHVENGLTALLLETQADSENELSNNIAAIQDALQDGFAIKQSVSFTTKEEEYSQYWNIRSGVFPAVGGKRAPSTTSLIEDVAFHPDETLPEAITALQKLLHKHGYTDACIYGHALEGNFHFILNQSFQTSEEIARYERLMSDLKILIVDTYDGSLKAEHGTGRNMASFVKDEWGEKAWDIMTSVKRLFDPENLLNPGVIFNEDPLCHLKHLKPLPSVNPIIDKCIECGFCEVSCLSCGFTLSSRQRIVVYREIMRLQESREDPSRLSALKKQYRYHGLQTCAADGLCSMSCPMTINTGDLTHYLRGQEMLTNGVAHKVGHFSARHLSGLKSALRGVLWTANVAHSVLGTRIMTGITATIHRISGIPLWTPAMPKPYRQPDEKLLPKQEAEAGNKVVYFPSCLNQTMGVSHSASEKAPVVNEMISLLQKTGYEIIFPERMDALCCGTIWESKGMEDFADQKSTELEKALWVASQEGKYPVLCDQSPCLYRMRKTMSRIKLYEPVEFIHTFLIDRLQFTPVPYPISIHITCSMRKMGLEKTLIALAQLCAEKVMIPEEKTCCGFAGDKGFTHPEVNEYALRNLKKQVEEAHVKEGFCNSRTCEIGLSTHSGITYRSIVSLINGCTERKHA